MLSMEAMDLLGLTLQTYRDVAAINAAYKAKIREVHPDKNGTPLATARTQALNEAKQTLLEFTPEYLLNSIEKVRRDAEDELAARRVEREASERQAERAREAQVEARRLYEEKINQMMARVEAARRERFIKNRRKRAAGTRAHRPTSSNPELTKLNDDMTAFFKASFASSPSKRDHVLSQDVASLFIASREGNISKLERDWFRQHCKTVLLRVFPAVQAVRREGKHAFAFIRYIQE